MGQEADAFETAAESARRVGKWVLAGGARVAAFIFASAGAVELLLLLQGAALSVCKVLLQRAGASSAG